VYKWMEAVGFVLQSGDRPELRAMAKAIIDLVVSVQEPDGYLNTYFQDDRKSLRMLTQTQTTGHELYNIGHMLQGAIAYYRATGDRKLLDAGIRFVDEFLLPIMGQRRKSLSSPAIRKLSWHSSSSTASRATKVSSIWPVTSCRETSGCNCPSAGPSTCSAGRRSRRAPTWKDMLFAPCTLAAGRPTITWKQATRRIGRR
jgi:hypothetical protein